MTQLLPEWFTWMRLGQNPPEGFSVFATRRLPESDGQPWTGRKRRVHLPQRIVVGDRSIRFMSKTVGLGHLDVTAVWHPEWPIHHPLVSEGRADRLWPNPHPVDLTLLEPIHPHEFAILTDATTLNLTEDELRQIAGRPLTGSLSPLENLLSRLAQRSPSNDT